VSAPSAWAEAARLRQGLYRFFAATLLPPSSERLEMLAESVLLLNTLGIEEYAFAPAWNRVVQLMAAPPDLSELDTEYVRMFESGVDSALCPPNESFYTTSARTGGTATALSELSRLYRELGLTAGGVQSIQPDHVSTELEVMSALCAQEADLAERAEHHFAGEVLNHEQAFLTAHLAGWFPMFAERVSAASPPFFYEATVVAADAFVRHDTEWVTELSSLDVPT